MNRYTHEVIPMSAGGRVHFERKFLDATKSVQHDREFWKALHAAETEEIGRRES